MEVYKILLHLIVNKSLGIFRLKKYMHAYNIRLSEGDGEAMYELGVDDDGTLVGIVYTYSFIIISEAFNNWTNHHNILTYTINFIIAVFF